MPYNVLIVDDQKVARMLFESIVGPAEQYDLIASIPSARQAADLCVKEKIDLVLLDVVLTDGYHGIEAAEEIKAKSPKTKIIVMTSMPEVSYMERARAAGVESFWYKEVQELPLLTLMDRTMAGESIYPDSTPTLIVGNSPSVNFTTRELEVLRLVTRGRTNAEIAETLHMGERTVKQHITNMLEKTGYANRTILAVQARALGLVIEY